MEKSTALYTSYVNILGPSRNTIQVSQELEGKKEGGATILVCSRIHYFESGWPTLMDRTNSTRNMSIAKKFSEDQPLLD